MLDCTGKLFEKLLTAKLREYLTTSRNTTENQYGFKSGRSTIDAMSRVKTIFQNANGKGQGRNLFVGMLTLDVKNAFNSASSVGIRSALRTEWDTEIPSEHHRRIPIEQEDNGEWRTKTEVKRGELRCSPRLCNRTRLMERPV